MSIAFDQIPANERVPGTYAEFAANQQSIGAQIKPFELLVICQRLSAGTVAEKVPTTVLSKEQAGVFFGVGSIAEQMAERLFANNRVTPVTFVALDDDGGAVAATSAVVFTGAATAAGTVAFYIGGRRVTFAVAAGDATTVQAAAFDAAVTAAVGLPVTSGVVSSTVTLTARHAGATGNGIDLRVNYNAGEALPAGVAITIPAMTSGATDPTIDSTLWAALGDVQYDVIAFPYSLAAQTTPVTVEMTSRADATRGIPGMAVGAIVDTHANILTLTDALNSEYLCMPGVDDTPTPSWEIAAAVAARVARHGQNDPAAPFNGRVLSGILTPPDASVFDQAEQRLLLLDGASTLQIRGTEVQVNRLITTNQTDSGGAPSTVFLSINTPLTLAYFRFDLETRLEARFQGFKFAQTAGNRFDAGQRIATLASIRSEVVALAQSWVALGLMEDIAQFKQDALVQANPTDVNRADILIRPNLVNQLHVKAVRVEFNL